MRTCGPKVDSQRACPTHGNTKRRRALLSINHTTSSSMSLLVVQTATSQMDNAPNHGLTPTHMLSTLSGMLNQLGAKHGKMATQLSKLITSKSIRMMELLLKIMLLSSSEKAVLRYSLDIRYEITAD